MTRHLLRVSMPLIRVLRDLTRVHFKKRKNYEQEHIDRVRERFILLQTCFLLINNNILRLE